MHHVWTGVARYLYERGDHSLDFVLEEAARGEVFAFGYSEPGNDLVLFGSRTQARPDGGGGYSFHGRKIFTSLSPAWTRLGVLGIETAPENGPALEGDPRLVHAFVTREGGGVDVLDDWDTVGMRASQSRTTMLVGAHAPADRVVRRLAPDPRPTRSCSRSSRRSRSSSRPCTRASASAHSSSPSRTPTGAPR